MSQHRGRGGRATDGKRAWRIDNVDYVGASPPDYVPPHDPTRPLPAHEHNRPRSDGSGCYCGACFTLLLVLLLAIDILVRLLG